jgi:hypothetical protein
MPRAFAGCRPFFLNVQCPGRRFSSSGTALPQGGAGYDYMERNGYIENSRVVN